MAHGCLSTGILTGEGIQLTLFGLAVFAFAQVGAGVVGYHKRSDPAVMHAKAEIERLRPSGERWRRPVSPGPSGRCRDSRRDPQNPNGACSVAQLGRGVRR